MSVHFIDAFNIRYWQVLKLDYHQHARLLREIFEQVKKIEINIQ
jgi:hypothetical protein